MRPDPPQPPPGLSLREDLVTPAEEERLLAVLDGLDFRELTMRGRTARRTVRHFGLRYDYASGGAVPTDPLPEAMAWLRERCAALMEREPEELAQVLLTRYPPGAGIGWHLDAPMFGPIAGVSLGAACRMRFRPAGDGRRETREVGLAPRSAYLLAGEARWEWQHMIPPAKELRHSITFRTLDGR